MREQIRRPRFLIVSPPQLWGGTIVLHLLCRMLADRGYDAKVFRLRIGERIPRSRQELLQKYLPFMNGKGKQVLDSQEGPIKGCKLTNWPYVDDDTIVVYPEVVFGNPLGAKHVVRWFLNVNRFTGEYEGEQPYGKEDMFICYRDVFNDYRLNPACRQVTLRHFDYDLYKRWNYGHREGSCFIVRKGGARVDLPPTVPGVVIDHLTEEKKVEVLNQCRYCYSFDTQTFYSTIAAICGCVSIVIPEPGKTRDDYLCDGEKGWGIAYGINQKEIDFARKTCKKLEEEIESYKSENIKNVQAFLDYCEEYFKKRMDKDICW